MRAGVFDADPILIGGPGRFGIFDTWLNLVQRCGRHRGIDIAELF